jgi:hypothetical protein
MRPHWFFVASLAIVCALLAATLLPTHRQNVAVLDRLAPRIERAQMLAPETKDAILQVVDRARVSTGDPRNDMRRSVTIERVTNAIKARGGDPALSGSVGQSVSAK